MKTAMGFTTPGLSKYPKEGEIIGRLLAGYGELEYALGTILAAVLDDHETMTKVLFRVRGEEARIQIADALMRHKFATTSAADLYKETISDMQHCRTIRNQFAHCLFDGHSFPNTLSFVDLERTAKAPGDSKVASVPIGLDVLRAQEAYFGYVQWRMFFLAAEYPKLIGKISQHTVKLPAAIPRPPLDNRPPK